MDDQLESSSRPAAGRWKFFLARLFGLKVQLREGEYTLTGYVWRGTVYLTDFR